MLNSQIANLPKQESFSERFRKIADRNKTQESQQESILRNVGQNVARAGETVIGFPGNIKGAFQKARDSLTYLFGGSNLGQLEEKAFGLTEKPFLFNPPTSSELRETATKNISEALTGNREYLEPRGKTEEAIGELTQDLTSFFMPGTGQLKLATRIGAPILGNFSKQGLKYVGADEETAEKAKLGVMLMTSLARQSDPAKMASERISKSKQMIPENATANIDPLLDSMTKIENRLNRGVGVPSKSKTLIGIKDLRDQAKNGRLSLHSLMDARDNINEWIAEAGGFEVPQAVRDPAIRNLNQLKSEVIKTIDQNLSSRFPKAAELYKTGYEAAAVNHRSNVISNAIQKYFGKDIKSVGLKVLFPSLAAGGATIIPKTAAISAATIPIYKTGQVLYRVANSPTLNRYYQKVIAEASVGNVNGMIISMQHLDKALAEDEKKQNKGKKQTLEEFKAKFQK